MLIPVKVFISYSHADEAHIARLHKHLAQLEREGTIAGWYDREIHLAGKLDDEITRELEASRIFLACASPDYIASEYCYDKELTAALAREAKGELAIAPVILEPCDWLQTPLSKFKAVPTDGKPVSEFTNPNAAFLNVVSELRRLAQEMTRDIEFKSAPAIRTEAAGSSGSRYRIQRDHDELHKRDFIEQSFKEIYEFFKVSAGEIAQISDIEVRLSEFSQRHFQCTIINRGRKRAFETLQVRTGGSFGAIDVLYGEERRTNTSNGGFGVRSDQYQLYFSPMMLALHSGAEKEKMSSKDVAQLLWDDLLSKVGIDYA